jgi:hypothetical protein
LQLALAIDDCIWKLELGIEYTNHN